MIVAISDKQSSPYRFAAPYITSALTRTAVSAHDIRFIFSRKAAPRLSRPEQFAIEMADGRQMDVTADQWHAIYDAARNDRNIHWSPSRWRDRDEWSAKWQAIRLDGNEYGRFLED